MKKIRVADFVRDPEWFLAASKGKRRRKATPNSTPHSSLLTPNSKIFVFAKALKFFLPVYCILFSNRLEYM